MIEENEEESLKQNQLIAILIVIISTVLIIASTALGIIDSMSPMVTGKKCESNDHCITMAQEQENR